MMTRPLLYGWLSALLVLPAAGHASRQAASEAALQLAEAIYPGQLELQATYLRKGFYEVVLTPHGDTITRIRLAMDPDPANCRLGTRCETRLRRAYTLGMAQGQEIRALDAAFRACGMPILAVEQPGGAATFVPVIAHPLNSENRAQVAQAVAACATGYRDASRAQPWWAERQAMRVTVASLPQGRAQLDPPAPLTSDVQVPTALQAVPAYAFSIALDGPAASVNHIAFAPFRALQDRIQQDIRTAADRFARDQDDDLQQEAVSLLRQTRVDPQQVDLIDTYILACTPAARQGRRCARGDVALHVRYDLGKSQVVDIARLPLARDALGSPLLPPFPAQ